MLIREKVDQAKQLLREFEIDCWITFVRESQLNGDPVLPFLVSSDVTWHSAFLVSAGGETRAIVGRYDQKTVEETGAWDTVVGFVEGIRQPLTEYLRQLDELGEDPADYAGLYGYSMGQTEPRMPPYEYPDCGFPVTDALTNFELPKVTADDADHSVEVAGTT